MTDANGNGMIMPVTPYYGNGFGGGDGMFGGNSAWWVIILLILFGWNGNNGFSGGGNGMQRGFDQNAVMNGLSSIQNAVNNGFSSAEVAANSRQMADMQQNFSIQSALQQCCCDNRAATADLKYTVATESANTRANCNDNNQKVLDKLCQLELDGVRNSYENRLATKDAEIANLYRQLAANSQANQTGQIMQGFAAMNEAQTAALERYLAPTPIPAYVVQNPNCCQQNYGCGCGSM